MQDNKKASNIKKLNFLGFGPDGPSLSLISKLEAFDEHRCLDGNLSRTILRVSNQGTVALCDEQDCGHCSKFNYIKIILSEIELKRFEK